MHSEQRLLKMLTLSFLLPCFLIVLLAGSIQSLDKSTTYCEKYHEGQTQEILVAGGSLANPKEFPHAALIGFGNDDKDYRWSCTGSLISDEIILTAGHCLNSIDAGPPKVVRLGDLDFNSSSDDAASRNFKVKEIISHPSYKAPLGYNDIGLIKLDGKVQFNDYIRPACLNRETIFPTNQLLSVGWGKLEFAGEQSSRLLKNVLVYVDNEKCRKAFDRVSSRKLPQGIVDVGQVCFAAAPGKNTCESIGGSPLQIIEKSKSLWYYSLVGITSLGRACGLSDNDIVVYTRVSNSIKWIEDTVWP